MSSRRRGMPARRGSPFPVRRPTEPDPSCPAALMPERDVGYFLRAVPPV